MIYITVKQSPRHHQITFEELISQSFDKNLSMPYDPTGTKTYEVEKVSDAFKRKLNVDKFIKILKVYNEQTAPLRAARREELYHTFFIPKKSGGLRRIDKPNDGLMLALRRLKGIFENDFGAMYHTNAFAYIRGRCTIDAVKKHQANESKWFGKFDLSNFFGSTTLDFMMQQFSMVFPFSEVVKSEEGKEQLRLALELATLNGGLPQGTPVSPTITNIMMIPIDFKLANTLRDFENQRYVYTRYADDFIISSRYTFDVKKVEGLIVSTLRAFNAPFALNQKKTRYGSSAGRNWNLGVMLNKDNEITIGHKRKKQFQNALYNYARDKKENVPWNIEDVRTLDGLMSYYTMVEKETINRIVEHMSHKTGVDIKKCIRDDIANCGPITF